MNDNKRVIIVHGWDGHPEEWWLPWLKKELEIKSFEVSVPQMPDAGLPRINKWIPALAGVAGEVNENTFFVGHSIGCQAIIRYLEKLPVGKKIGGVVFVAGFLRHITNLEQEEEIIDVDREWAETPIDFASVRSHLPKSVAIFSTNDKFVSMDNRDDFREKLGSEIITVENMGHFSGSTGTKELPIALGAVLKLSAQEQAKKQYNKNM